MNDINEDCQSCANLQHEMGKIMRENAMHEKACHDELAVRESYGKEIDKLEAENKRLREWIEINCPVRDINIILGVW